MPDLNPNAQAFLSQIANASGISGLANKLITIAQESPTFVDELNGFANNSGTFQVVTGTAGLSASFNYSGYSDNASGVIKVGLPGSVPTTSIVPDVYATGSMPTSGTQDYAATIIGSLAHELGHYEDAFSNPYYTNTSSLSGAGYIANALVSEGVAEQNNLVVQKEIAQNSDGQYVISFLLASDQNTNNNGFSFNQSVEQQFADGLTGNALVSELASITAIAANPSINNSPNYLQYYTSGSPTPNLFGGQEGQLYTLRT